MNLARVTDGSSDPTVWLGLPDVAHITLQRPTAPAPRRLVDEVASFGLLSRVSDLRKWDI